MGRILPRVVIAVVIFSLLLMAAPPALSAAVRVRIGRYSTISARVRKQIGNFLKKHASDIITSALPDPGGQNQGDNHLDTKAADTAGLYVFDISVGTSVLQNITGILDITTELVWTQCQCSATDACLPPPATTFQPSASGTFSGIPCTSQTCQSAISQPCEPADNCTYVMKYSDYANTTGYLANDTFTFGQTPVPGVVFGCSNASSGDFSGASGVLGFSRGNLSLVSQLQLSWFSYLLASDSDGSDNHNYNHLEFGDDTVPETKNSRSTLLLSNDVYPDLYFVKLTGITVDGRQLNGIPAGTFDLQADGSGGVFLSTTVPVTYLEEAAYSVVKQAIASRIKSEAVNGSALGLDLCYTLQAADEMTVPKLALVFDGRDAAMELKKHNYFFADNVTGLECMTILPSKGGSLLGSLLQTDTNMTYDIDGGRLIFETASAPQQPHFRVSLMVAVQLVAWALLV